MREACTVGRAKTSAPTYLDVSEVGPRCSYGSRGFALSWRSFISTTHVAASVRPGVGAVVEHPNVRRRGVLLVPELRRGAARRGRG